MAECTNISAQQLDGKHRYVRVNQFAKDQAIVVHIGREKSMVSFSITDEEGIALRNMLIATYRDVPVPPMANHKRCGDENVA